MLAARQNATANAKAAIGIGSTVGNTPGDLDTTSTGTRKTLLGV